MPSFRYCFEAHREDGMVCAIQVGKSAWWLTRRIVCNVPTETWYYGAEVPNPRFVVRGQGRITYGRDVTVID